MLAKLHPKDAKLPQKPASKLVVLPNHGGAGAGADDGLLLVLLVVLVLLVLVLVLLL